MHVVARNHKNRCDFLFHLKFRAKTIFVSLNLQSAWCWFQVQRGGRLWVTWKWCNMDWSTVGGNVASVISNRLVNSPSPYAKCQSREKLTLRQRQRQLVLQSVPNGLLAEWSRSRWVVVQQYLAKVRWLVAGVHRVRPMATKPMVTIPTATIPTATLPTMTIPMGSGPKLRLAPH